MTDPYDVTGSERNDRWPQRIAALARIVDHLAPAGSLDPDTADPPAPIRNFDDLLIAHQRLIGGALREIIRRGGDEGSLGRLVRELEAALPRSIPSTAPSESVAVGPPRRSHRPLLPVPGGG